MHIIESISEISQEQNFPIFFWDKWKTVEEKLHHKQWFLCADDEGNVVAFTVYTMKFFKKADYLYVPLDRNGERLSVEKEKMFLDEFHKYLKREKYADVIFPPSHVVVFNAIPSKALWFKFGIMACDLTQDIDALFKNTKPNTRNEIRKAESYGVETKFVKEFVDDFYSIFQSTVNQKKFAAPPKEYFMEMSEILGNNINVGVAYLNGAIESSEFSVIDNKNIYVMYAGTSFTPQYKGSNKYLIWNLFKYCKSQGIEKLLYGGYRYGLQENDSLYYVQKFKKHLGVEVIDGFHFIKVINPIKYAVVNFAMKCKSLLTGKDCSFVNLKGLDVKKSE